MLLVEARSLVEKAEWKRTDYFIDPGHKLNVLCTLNLRPVSRGTEFPSFVSSPIQSKYGEILDRKIPCPFFHSLILQ